jgi:hypothetical protein
MFVTRFIRVPEPIQRGDIVILIPPVYMEESGKYYVKRVIGLPGEKAEKSRTAWSISTGSLWMNRISRLRLVRQLRRDHHSRGRVISSWRQQARIARFAPPRRSAPSRRASIEGKSVLVMWPFSSWRGLSGPSYPSE